MPGNGLYGDPGRTVEADMVEKAVILARGLATRMRRRDEAAGLPARARRMARSGLKSLIPVGGRPFLDYIVGSLLAAGLRRICLVIAPDCDMLRDYAARVGDCTGADACAAVQEKPLGTADAVLAAEGFAGRDPFLLCNGDDLYPDEALRAASAGEENCCLVAFDSEALVREGNIREDRVRDFAAVVPDGEGNLLEIVEKPRAPERYVRDGKLWVSMNLYRFTPQIFDACREVEPNAERGELELTGAVEKLLRDGVPFKVVFCTRGVLDLTSPADVASAQDILRERAPGFPPLRGF